MGVEALYAQSCKMMRAKAQREVELAELESIDPQHWLPTRESIAGSSTGAAYRQRVTSKKVKHLLLNHLDTIIRGGLMCCMHVEKLGFGVCDISFQDPKGE